MPPASPSPDGLLELLPDAHVVVSRAGVLLAGNARGLALLRPEHPLLRVLAGSAVLPPGCRLLQGDTIRDFDVAFRDVEWAGTPARLLRLSPRRVTPPATADASAHVRLLEGVLDALPTMVLLLDGDGTILEGNARWHVAARLHDLPLADGGVGANYLAVCDRASADGDRDAGAVAAGIRDVLAGRALAFEHEYEFETDEGYGIESYRLVVHAIDGHAGAIVQHVATTDLRREQRMHNEAYAHFAAVFEFALDAMVIVDDEMRCLSTNAAAARLLGREREAVAAMTLGDMLADADASTVDGFWQRLGATGEQRGLLALRHADGGRRLVDVAARAGVVAGRHLLVMRDVTDAHRLEEELRQSQKLQAIGQLTGGIAHDFNNVLTVILANAELLALDDPFPAGVSGDEPRRGVREVLAAAQRGRDMVRKLLAFGRKERLRVAGHSLDRLVVEICETLRRVLPEAIEVRHAASGALPAVKVDPNALHHILLNLATNARDAMPQGGLLELRLGADPLVGDATDDAPPHHRWVHLTVRDSGSGMDAATLARAFEPFYTTKPVGEGTGLGLPMVYGLMDQMGGHASIASQPGAGTTVTLSFAAVDAEDVPPGGAERPVAAPAVDFGAAPVRRNGRAPEASDRPVGGRAAAGHAATIVLVEDDRAIRSLATRILRSRGYDVVVAADGAEAERRLAERAAEGARPDLVVSDLVMPGGGGLVVARAVRRWAPETPVVWMTGHAFDARNAAGAALSAMPGTVLQKPWTIEALLETVRAALADRPHALLAIHPERAAFTPGGDET